MKLNILITSISRKVWLIQAFKNALEQAGVEGKVVSVDSDKLSAGLYLSDRYYLVPPTSNKNFLPIISEICQKEKVRLLIPTRDGELGLFAQNRAWFAERGILVMVSKPEVIKTCQDKYAFYQFLMRHNIPAPATFLLSHYGRLPHGHSMIVKPRYGSGGGGVIKISSPDQLDCYINYFKQRSGLIIQELINGQEYTLDAFADFEGNVISVIPRERLEIINGESYKTKTVSSRQMIKYTIKLIKEIGAVGQLTIQCIKKGRRIAFLEMNPRFGGGAMLGIRTGGNSPLFLINLARGRKLRPQIGKYTKGLTMLRYTEDLFL